MHIFERCATNRKVNFICGSVGIWIVTSLIYTIERYTGFDEALKRLEGGIANGVIDAFTSELTLSEVLVKPIADGDVKRIQIYERSLRNGESFNVLPVDRNILIEAASIRALSKLKLPDAIHFATACLNECTYFLTNDDHFKTMKNHQKIKILSLQQLPHFTQ